MGVLIICKPLPSKIEEIKPLKYSSLSVMNLYKIQVSLSDMNVKNIIQVRVERVRKMYTSTVLTNTGHSDDVKQ